MKVLPNIDSKLATWISEQKMFFVGTAPLAQDGHVNLSPKGGDSFRVLEPLKVAYLDYTGSGAETIAHLRENGRIVIMFCAFDGPPKIARLHGTGEAIFSDDPRFADLAKNFPENPGTRAIILINVERVADSCGYSVPNYEYTGNRDVLDKWAATKGTDGVKAYQAQKNHTSIDGLPAVP